MTIANSSNSSSSKSSSSSSSSDLSIDVWHVRTEDVRDEGILQICASLMTPEERVKHDAFMFEQHRHEFLVTRALVRFVLGVRLNKEPSELTFLRNAYGRPELSPPSSIRFNLTNTTKLVACAIGSSREVGVDAEPLVRGEDILEVAETVFTANERDMLARLDLKSRRRRAVELWTLKEAYIKARGLGMSLPVERFEVHFEGDDARALRFFAPVSDDPGRWILATHEIDDHLVSTCVERHADRNEAHVIFHRADLPRLLDGSTSIALKKGSEKMDE